MENKIVRRARWLCWLLGPSVQKSRDLGSMISLFNHPTLRQLMPVD